MAYVPNAQDYSEPTGDKSVSSAAPEFRALKQFTVQVNQALVGFQAELDALEAAIGAGDNSVALAANLAAGMGGMLVGFLQTGTGAILRNTYRKLLEQPVSPEDFGAVGDGVATDYFALNLAWTQSRSMKLTTGKTYNLGNNALAVPDGGRIWSEGPRLSTKLTRTGTGPILTTPENCSEIYVSNIYFTGSGNTQIGIYTDPAGVGDLRSYLISPQIVDCDFSWDLDYGIKSCLIFGKIYNNTFGLYGTGAAPAAGLALMKGIWSEHTFASNYSNLNHYLGNKFRCGSTTVGAVTVIGGINNSFQNCDWENGGICCNLQDAWSTFNHCWTEACNTPAGLFKVDGSTGTGKCVFEYCQIDYSAAHSAFFYSSGVLQGFDVNNSNLGSSSGTNVIFYDNNTASIKLPGNGSIAYWNNATNSSNASDTTKDVNFRGGVSGVRFQAILNTATGFSYSSDPACVATPGATGIITISGGSMPWASSTGRVMVKIQPLNGTVTQASYTVASLNNFTITLKNAAGANTAGDCYIEVCGM